MRRWRAPGAVERIDAALARFSAAVTSPVDLITTERRSRSASACLAITLCMSSGSIISFSSTVSTFIPH